MGTGTARRRVAAALDSAGALTPIARLRERWIAARSPEGPAVGPDGLPMPPSRLRVLVDGHADPGGFIEDSALGAEMIRATVRRAGTELEELGSILDFGCGCGRTARHWARLDGPEVHGCDYNPELVAWCEENLPFMSVRANQADPPAPYPDDRFDLVYAISILTHLTEAAAEAWIAEYARILRPGGLLLVTTHGDTYRDRLTAPERQLYDAGEPVTQRAGMEGTNTCAAYHPPAWVTGKLLAGFDVLVSDGEDGGFPQDVYLARLPA
jgi:SAM-dependent methyltransferase